MGVEKEAVLILLTVLSIGLLPSGQQTLEGEAILVRTADWLVEHQNPNGTYTLNMTLENGEYQDAIALGCAAVILLEVYHITGDQSYLRCANNTLSLLAEWQNYNGGWSGHTFFTAEGTYYPLVAFSKYQLYTGDERYDVNIRMAARRLIYIVGRRYVEYPYVFELGEHIYAMLLAWMATGEDDYKAAADLWVETLVGEFDHDAGAWNTMLDGSGPQGMWDAAIPCLPLLVWDYPELRAQAEQALSWASSLEVAPGGYAASHPDGDMVIKAAKWSDRKRAYSHYTGEFLLLASVTGRFDLAGKAFSWLVQMQSPEGGFYFRSTLGGGVDERLFVWDTYWAFFGILTYLREMFRVKVEDMVLELNDGLGMVEGLVNTSTIASKIREAEDLLSAGRYFEAYQSVLEANESLRLLLDAYNVYKEGVENVSRLAETGVNLTAAYATLEESKRCLAAGDFDKAKEYAQLAAKQASDAVEAARREAEDKISMAKALLDQAAGLGLDVSEASYYVGMAEDSFNSAKYSLAIFYADQAVAKLESLISSSQGGRLEFSGYMKFIIVPVAIVVIALLAYRFKPSAEERALKELEKYMYLMDKYIILRKERDGEEE